MEKRTGIKTEFRLENAETAVEKFNLMIAGGDYCDLMHDVDTNKIAYLRYMFDISDLEEEELPYLGLLKTLIGLMDTKNYSYKELFNEIHIRTGGMGVVTNFFPNFEDDADYKLTLDVKTKVLYGQMDKAYEIMEEMVFNTDFSDKKRFKE